MSATPCNTMQYHAPNRESSSLEYLYMRIFLLEHFYTKHLDVGLSIKCFFFFSPKYFLYKIYAVLHYNVFSPAMWDQSLRLPKVLVFCDEVFCILIFFPCNSELFCILWVFFPSNPELFCILWIFSPCNSEFFCILWIFFPCNSEFFVFYGFSSLPVVLYSANSSTTPTPTQSCSVFYGFSSLPTLSCSVFCEFHDDSYSNSEFFCILWIFFPSNSELFCILRIPRRLLFQL